MAIALETSSPAESFIQQVGWEYKPSGVDQACIRICPNCQNANWKFYVNVSGGEQDGLSSCKVCEYAANLYQLREKAGVRSAGIISTKDLASSSAPPLSDWRLAHKRLMEDDAFEDVLDYLVIDRGFTVEVLDRFKVGAEEGHGQKWVVIPYLNQEGSAAKYIKYRSVPPSPKAFRSSPGREVPLFNEIILTQPLEEIVICEGESDCMSLLSLGYSSAVGLPGANTQKAAWIDRLDTIPNVYILLDLDQVGQKAARELAARIDIQKVKNIVIPPFVKADGAAGKDLNDRVLAGLTLEQFQELKKQSRAFDVEGVHNLHSLLTELETDIAEKGTEPSLKTPWPSQTQRMGGCEFGELIGVLAEAKVGKTTYSLNWLQYYVEQGLNCLFYCQEMPPKRLVRKWMSMVTKTDDTPGKSQVTPATVRSALSIAETLPGEMLFAYTRSSKAEEIMSTIRQAVRRYGVKVVCFDNLQLMVRSLEHSVQETSKYSKMFKELAMELNILIILIIQPNRVSEGSLVKARNAGGSSAPEKDVDTMICLNRKRVAMLRQSDLGGVVDTNETFEPTLYADVDLPRYGTGGMFTLYFDGATSSVRELNAEEFTSFARTPGLGVIAQEMVQV